MIKPKFEIGKPIYLKTDSDQEEHILTGYTVRPGVIIYLTSLYKTESPHYEFELTAEPDPLKKLI